eukprot:4528214-Ditylum_brightwellii.AAC.1
MQVIDLNNKKQLYYLFMVALYPHTEKLDTKKKKSIIDLLETQFVDDVGGFQRTLEHPKTSALVVTMQ